MKKAVSTAMALSMMVGLMGVNVNVNASAYEAGSYDGVSITMLNTKSELQDYLVDAAAEWGELTGASLDVYTSATAVHRLRRSQPDMQRTMHRP